MKHAFFVITAFMLASLASAAEWIKMPGSGRDVVAGADGSVWVIGTNAVYGGHDIYKWNGTNNWGVVDGGATRIAIDSLGQPWVVNSMGDIYRRSGNSWAQLPGKATDIVAGADGSVFILGVKKVGEGYDLHKWNSSEWTAIEGSAAAMTVDKTGVIWVTHEGGDIYTLSASKTNTPAPGLQPGMTKP
jgi:hypothetical protein